MKLKLLTLKIEIPESRFKPRAAEKIRGYIGNLYKDNLLFHQHTDDGKTLYQYPRIQYKVIDGVPYIIGLEEGADALKRKFVELRSLVIENKKYEMFEKDMKIEEVDFGIAKDQIPYKFITPWYALNQNNYKKYLKAGSQSKRILQLKQILIGNLLSLSKSLGEVIKSKIVVKSLEVFEHPFGLDDLSVIGFLGNFSVNFAIPDYLGLGKSVSRGFGTVKRTV